MDFTYNEYLATSAIETVQLKKIKSWGRFWTCQLNSTANLAHLPRNKAEWAELAVLFSW